MDSQKLINAIENGKLADASDIMNDLLLSRIGASLEETKGKVGETLVSGVDVQEEEDSEYDRFFRAALKKFGVSSPADFDSEEEKKKFFNYIDKNFKAKNESVEIDEAKSLMSSGEGQELLKISKMYDKKKAVDDDGRELSERILDLMDALRDGDKKAAKGIFDSLTYGAQEIIPDSVYEKIA